MVKSRSGRHTGYFIVPVFGVVLLFAGCSGIGSSVPIANPTVPVTVTAGKSTAPLPSNIPLPNFAVLTEEYAATLNSQTGVTWLYVVQGITQTPTSIISFYQTNMPKHGWTPAPVPPESTHGKYGGTAIAFKQGSQVATIAAGVDSKYPQAVVLLISVAPYSG